MDLDAETVVYVEEFDKQGKLVAVAVIDNIAHQVAHIGFKDVFKIVTLEETFADHALVLTHIAENPALADMVRIQTCGL